MSIQTNKIKNKDILKYEVANMVRPITNFSFESILQKWSRQPQKAYTIKQFKELTLIFKLRNFN